MSSKDTQDDSSKSVLEKASPILLLIVIALAFFVGILWQRVINLEKDDVKGAKASPAPTIPLSVENIKKYAKDLGLNQKDFDKCLDESAKKEYVDKDAAYASEVGVNGTPSFFINGHFVSGAQPYTVFEKAIEYELAEGDWSKPTSEVKDLVDGNPNNGEVAVDKTQVQIGDAPVKGNIDAKVVVIEFSDFECPYCERYSNLTYKQIVENYIDQGKVLYSFRHIPLPFHSYAQKAAEASMCASDQGKFWEMHDTLFAKIGEAE